MGLKNIVKYFKESDSFWAGLLRDFQAHKQVEIISTNILKLILINQKI